MRLNRAAPERCRPVWPFRQQRRRCEPGRPWPARRARPGVADGPRPDL